MLRNEKYIGDALLQKTYDVDCISEQVKKNNSEVARYYVENNHEANAGQSVIIKDESEIVRHHCSMSTIYRSCSRYSSSPILAKEHFIT